MNDPATTQEIIDGIIAGYLDSDLDRIKAALDSRRDELQESRNRKLKYAITPGTHVWFNRRTRPEYMQGAEAVVVEINRTRIVVKLIRPVGRFRGDRVTTALDLVSLSKEEALKY